MVIHTYIYIHNMHITCIAHMHIHAHVHIQNVCMHKTCAYIYLYVYGRNIDKSQWQKNSSLVSRAHIPATTTNYTVTHNFFLLCVQYLIYLYHLSIVFHLDILNKPVSGLSNPLMVGRLARAPERSTKK